MEVDEELEEQNDQFHEMSDENIKEFGLDDELLQRINEQKREGMFVSAWQEDEQDLYAKDQGSPIEAFLTAAEEGKIDEVKSLLQENPQLLNATDCDGYTALHRSCYNDHLEVVNFLLDNGADLEARTNENWTPLHSACNWANFEVVGCLLSRNADVNLRSKGSVTPLHLALCSQEDSERIFHTVRYLLQAPGVDLSAVTGAGDTPLDLARRNHPACFDLIADRLQRL